MFSSSLSSILFTILKIICWAIDRLTQLFEVFSGLTKVSYKGEPTFLFNIFLNHSTINNVYWGMALIGIVLCFAFTIASVIRKLFDVNGKQQMSMGQILTEALKSIFIILGMNLVLSAALTATDVLLRQVNYLFLNAEGLNRSAVVEFTDDQYAAMGRALSTIANYGMNPSYNSRYNMNDCFNTIRPDLVYLEEQGVFDYAYPTDEGSSWQSVLQEVANSADLRYELKGDVYYDSVVKALEHALSVMRSDASFRPLERFEEQRSANASDVPLDRIVFLVGTLDAANNNFFNRDPSFTDALRLPYYTGEKSLYDSADYDSLKVISGDFNIDYSRFDYFVSFILGISVLINTFTILLALIARMFNILFLYIIAPPVLAVRPLDGGGKTRQWVSAFVIQLLGVFGSIIVMRLLLIFVPLIFEPELVLISGNSSLNYFAKAVMLIAAYAVAKKAGSLLSGILSDTAAMQSMQAGDMSSTAQRVIGTARQVAGRAVRTAGAAVSFAASPLTNVLRKPFDAYRRLGSGASDSDIRRQAKERLAVEKMVNQMRGASDKSGGGSDKGGGGPGGGHLPPRGGTDKLTKKLEGQQGPGNDLSRLKEALKVQPKAGEGPNRDRSNEQKAGDGLPQQSGERPKRDDQPGVPDFSGQSGQEKPGSIPSKEPEPGKQGRESYSPETGSQRDSGLWENASWMGDFQGMDSSDEEPDSFDVPSFLGGGRVSDYEGPLGGDLANDLEGPFSGDQMSDFEGPFGGDRMSDFEDSLQNDPLGGLREKATAETVPDLRTESQSPGGHGNASGGVVPPPPPPRQQTGGRQQPRQTGNTEPPRQSVNPGTNIPNQPTQPRNGKGGETSSRQQSNTEPPRQSGNTGTNIRDTMFADFGYEQTLGATVRSFDLVGSSEALYFRGLTVFDPPGRYAIGKELEDVFTDMKRDHYAEYEREAFALGQRLVKKARQ